ncbi:hypothetical protein JCM33374_g1717 [Metschnikowia sp. JCM 33374]|nr:hypothetical protein JCM33374_g1717 [Metschnikowia sp. JCM 33374]
MRIKSILRSVLFYLIADNSTISRPVGNLKSKKVPEKRMINFSDIGSDHTPNSGIYQSLLKHGMDVYVTEFRKAESLIIKFDESLQTFVNATDFDFEEFENRVMSLQDQLSDITTSVRDVSPCKELLRQLRLARKKFQAMVDVNESFKNFKALGLKVIVSFPKNISLD